MTQVPEDHKKRNILLTVLAGLASAGAGAAADSRNRGRGAAQGGASFLQGLLGGLQRKQQRQQDLEDEERKRNQQFEDENRRRTQNAQDFLVQQLGIDTHKPQGSTAVDTGADTGPPVFQADSADPADAENFILVPKGINTAELAGTVPAGDLPALQSLIAGSIGDRNAASAEMANRKAENDRLLRETQFATAKARLEAELKKVVPGSPEWKEMQRFMMNLRVEEAGLKSVGSLDAGEIKVGGASSSDKGVSTSGPDPNVSDLLKSIGGGMIAAIEGDNEGQIRVGDDNKFHFFDNKGVEMDRRDFMDTVIEERGDVLKFDRKQVQELNRRLVEFIEGSESTLGLDVPEPLESFLVGNEHPILHAAGSALDDFIGRVSTEGYSPLELTREGLGITDREERRAALRRQAELFRTDAGRNPIRTPTPVEGMLEGLHPSAPAPPPEQQIISEFRQAFASQGIPLSDGAIGVWAGLIGSGQISLEDAISFQLQAAEEELGAR